VTVSGVRRALWIAGWPVRALLLLLVRLYRLTLGQVIGGGCRFYPSCSAYAEQAIREVGAVRGTALTVWRILRCSPLSKGGIDHPPRGMYDNDIHSGHAVEGGVRV
jgi:putative membrane protein insertion efficiency factor